MLAVERLVLACIRHPVQRIFFAADVKDVSRLGCGIFNVPPSILDFVKNKLDDVPRRVSARDTKFTVQRVNELEAQVATVARLHRQVALGAPKSEKRAAGFDDWRRELIVFQEKQSPSVCETRNLHYVGPLRNGRHVYQVKAQPFQQPSQRQVTMWSFSK